jgi:hypothetical protein
MSTLSRHRELSTEAHPVHRPASVVVLAAILVLLTIGCVQGGVAMIVDPVEPLGMPTSYLDDTPIDDYVLPGIFLLALGTASLVTSAGLIFRWDWRWAHAVEARAGHRWPWIGALATGGVLFAFELLELFLVPFHPVMHPLLIGAALAIIVLALTPGARRYLAVSSR